MALNSYNSAIEEIKSRSDIVDIISPLVNLKKTGSNYKGCCPFHKEKTPSFVVSQTKQIFTCFGCGATGDSIEFIKKYYNLSFPEAVKMLARQYGVDIEDSYEKQGKKKDVYYEANRIAARFFYDSFTGKANPAAAYMKKRGIEPKVLQQFGIGYCDENWQSLTDHMKEKGVSEEMLVELGLCAKSQKNGRLYDKFRGRVMFPIINTMGKVIGFGGRIINDGEPKYLNSQESIVFEKKRNLYGINLTKGHIQSEGYAVLVEGYMDVIGLYQGGVRNVAASLGTALTEEQAKLLKKYTGKVVICYDADAAGIKAALRGIDVLRAAGLDIRVLHVDDGKDPDDYIKKHGADEFRALIDKKSLPDVDYKLSLISRKYDVKDIGQGVKFLQAAARVIRGLSPVEADLYIKKIASAHGVSEGALRREVEDLPESPGRQNAARETQKPENESTEGASKGRSPALDQDESSKLLEKTLIKLCIQRSDFWERLSEYSEAFVTAAGEEIGDLFGLTYVENADFDPRSMKESLSENAAAYLDEIVEHVLTGDDEDAAFKDCLDKLDKNRAERRIREIMNILSIADEDSGPQLEKLMKEMAELQGRYRR